MTREELEIQLRQDEATWQSLSARARRRYRSPCCGSRRPWKHSVDCPTIPEFVREALRKKSEATPDVAEAE
jgi:hypothetical protein